MVVEVRMTRSKRAATKAAQGALNKTVLAQSDILHLILPQLDFASFVALRGTCRDIREGTQEVCEDLIQVLERAASLYVSPRFAEGLALLADHHPYVCWLLQVCARARVWPAQRAAPPLLARAVALVDAPACSVVRRLSCCVPPILIRASHLPARLSPPSRPSRYFSSQTPVLAIVARDRYDELISASYHLLQAHLSRRQKLAVSNSLRRAAAAMATSTLGPPCLAAHYRLLHLGVRLGMFTESPKVLRELLQAAEQAVAGLGEAHRSTRDQPPASAAAHYTIAGFYTYHHKNQLPEMRGALTKAMEHLNTALSIQQRQLGARHVATLCSQLVKAQVMLLQDNTTGCGRLLTKQLQLCELTLSPGHPLAAKMLAVMARLQYKQGHECECERLQQQVLTMRRAALGLHHEDTHRSAMDVYARRRQHVERDVSDPQRYVDLARALDVCFEMLKRACLEESGAESYALSKSLQGMGEYVFNDLCVLARRGLWPKPRTLEMLDAAADIAERLLTPHPADLMPGEGEVAAAQFEKRYRVIVALRKLRDDCETKETWPPVW